MSGEIHLAVVGAGQMGTGFAVHFRLHEQTVSLIDHRQSNLDQARERIQESVQFLNEQGITTMSPSAVLKDVAFTLDTEMGTAEADIVLETVSEDLELKRGVFQEFAGVTSEDTILATNTSSLQVSNIAAGFDFANRVVGCHWLYPPYLLPTVEVIAGEETDSEVVEELVALLKAVDRKPIVVQKDVPGFVWNRVQFAVLRECMHLVDTGVASLEDVNTAIRDGYARRTTVLGPFETVDLAGLDLFRTVASGIYPSLSDRDTPSPMYDDRLEAEETGVESGEGFFEYDRSADEVARMRDKQLADLRTIFDEDEE